MVYIRYYYITGIYFLVLFLFENHFNTNTRISVIYVYCKRNLLKNNVN